MRYLTSTLLRDRIGSFRGRVAGRGSLFLGFFGVAVAASALFMSGCSLITSKSLPAPYVNGASVVDSNFPCMELEFRQDLTYKGKRVRSSKSMGALIYSLRDRVQSISIYKFYSVEGIQYDSPIYSQYPASLILYQNDFSSVDSVYSSVIVYSREDENTYLLGVFMNRINENIIVNTEFKRLISTYENFNAAAWSKTNTGTRILGSMIDDLGFLAERQRLIPCTTAIPLRSDSWN